MTTMRAALVLSVASVCSTAFGAVDDPPNAGERSGVIVAIERAPAFDDDNDVACKRFAASDGVASRRYATVRFFSGRHAHTRVLPLASGFAAQVGDRVVFRSSGCTEIDAR